MKWVIKVKQILEEDIVGSGNQILFWTWGLSILSIVLLGFYLNSESMSFLGVAGSKERQVNFEAAVVLKRILVIPGQVIKKGDLIAELNQSDLNRRIRELERIIRKLESEQRVRQQLNHIVSGRQIQDADDPVLIDLSDLNEELRILEEQKRNLYIFADVDGIVGTVNFRKGEIVPAFSSLVSILPESPTFIEGFVHESLRTHLEIGGLVKVQSVTNQKANIEGRIVSVGSRIVAMPSRLALYPQMQIWGREVVIEIPKQSGLLLGEKVKIYPESKKYFNLSFSPVQLANAAASMANHAGFFKKQISKFAPDEGVVSSQNNFDDQNLDLNLGPIPSRLNDFNIPRSILRKNNFEPSGLIYLSDLKKYMVISDDTDEKKSPTVFLMDNEGNIEEDTLTIPGVKQVQDLESISQDTKFVYFMASQQIQNKNESFSRTLFIRTERGGVSLLKSDRVNLRSILLNAARQHHDNELARAFLNFDEKSFEIEGHFVLGDSLFLSFKNYFDENNKSLILKINGLDQIFETNKISPDQIVGIYWFRLFNKSQQIDYKVTDLIQHEGELYVTASCLHKKCGSVWRLDMQNNQIQPRLLQSYKDHHPEGIAFDSLNESFFITFDDKSSKAKWARLKIAN